MRLGLIQGDGLEGFTESIYQQYQDVKCDEFGSYHQQSAHHHETNRKETGCA